MYVVASGFGMVFYRGAHIPISSSLVLSPRDFQLLLGPLRMSSVTGLGNFSPVDRSEFKKHNQNGGTTCIVRDCHSFVESCNFTNKANSHTPNEEIHTRPKLCHFGLYVVRATLFCLKRFVPVTGLQCSYRKIFIPITETSVAKTDISVAGPARPLIWTHRYFYKEKSGEGRSRKPSQPGLPGSFEETLTLSYQIPQVLMRRELH